MPLHVVLERPVTVLLAPFTLTLPALKILPVTVPVVPSRVMRFVPVPTNTLSAAVTLLKDTSSAVAMVNSLPVRLTLMFWPSLKLTSSPPLTSSPASPLAFTLNAAASLIFCVPVVDRLLKSLSAALSILFFVVASSATSITWPLAVVVKPLEPVTFKVWFFRLTLPVPVPPSAIFNVDTLVVALLIMSATFCAVATPSLPVTLTVPPVLARVPFFTSYVIVPFAPAVAVVNVPSLNVSPWLNDVVPPVPLSAV